MILAKKLLMGINKPSNPSKPYVEFVSSTAMTITPKYTNTGITLQYSLNGTSWINIASGATTPSANIVYFRGQATETKTLFTTADTAANAWTFTGATNLECNGNINYLLQNYLGGGVENIALGNYAFSGLFYNNTSLISAPALPATTLADSCYNNMFNGCFNLTIAPALPATTLANSCYAVMFIGCTNLTVAPALPATTLASVCYMYMFGFCTKLTVAPSLPATTLASNCYNNMFNGCTKIKISTTLTGIYDTAYRIPTTGTGTTATDALTGMFAGTGGTFKGTPTINTTYYTENTPV